MSIKAKFIQFLKSNYSAWDNSKSHHPLEALISDQLLSETIIKLPQQTLSDIQTEISAYYRLRQWGVENLQSYYLDLGLKVPANEAICTSFDFHVTTDNQLKLIEINTNAAFLALGTELYKFHGVDNSFSSQDIIQMFSAESHFYKKDLSSVTIIDEKPEDQRMYVEFLLYQKIFERHGLECLIKDFKDITSTSIQEKDFIYNRYTDFYLSDPQSQNLRQLYNEQKIILSPNPYEYFLLADKQRMFDWQHQTQITQPSSLLKIYDLGTADKDFIWSERKKLFFKPKNSFGSKQAYKGASISHKTFEDFYGPTMLAQEYAQPQETSVKVADEAINMKFDLRCYAYRGKLQIVIARIYQGQTTNLRTNGGGFTIVEFKD